MSGLTRVRTACAGALAAPDLVLRDIHRPPAPSWWPPAPGWWLLAAGLALVVAAVSYRAWRRRRRRRAMARLFEQRLAAAHGPAARIAALSELLRRAARRRDPDADRLQGEDWLRFLDQGAKRREFDDETARLLLDGGYRRAVDAAQADALVPRVRRRFLDWTAGA